MSELSLPQIIVKLLACRSLTTSNLFVDPVTRHGSQPNHDEKDDDCGCRPVDSLKLFYSMHSMQIHLPPPLRDGEQRPSPGEPALMPALGECH